MKIHHHSATLLLLICSAAAYGQVPGSTVTLVGDWACYGYQESGSDTYSADYSVLHAADGTWRSEGRFGSFSASTGGMPFEWDFSASGTFSLEGSELSYSTKSIRFLPTRGGADYEAANPRDYMRLPMNGSWAITMPESIFMTLESDDGQLLFDCEKQVFD